MAKAWTNVAVAGGKYALALIIEVCSAIDLLWSRRGVATTGGTDGTTITLSPAESSVNYDITWTWNEDPGADMGEMWILPSEKLVGSFKVRNQGVSGKSFTWTLTRQLP